MLNGIRSDDEVIHSERTLIMTVGRGTPPHGLAKPLLRSIEAVDPHRIVFICTPTSRNESIKPLLAIAPDLLARIPHQIELVEEGDRIDLDAMFDRVLEIMDETVTAHPDADVHIDFTGGSKPMSAALVHAAMSRASPFAHYAEPNFDPASRGPTDTRIVHTISLENARAETNLRRLGQLFDHGEFVAVRLECKRLLHQPGISMTRRRDIANLESTASAAAAWDRFEWGTATQIMRSCAQVKLAESGWHTDGIAANLRHLEACMASIGPTLHVAMDILANGIRRVQRHQYADAVARFYRLVEYLVQWRFAECFKHADLITRPENPTAGIGVDRIREVAPDWFNSRRNSFPSDVPTVNLGLRDASTVIAERGEDFGVRVLEDLGPLRRPGRLGKLLQRRHESFLAHGSTPIRGETAKKLQTVAIDLLEVAAAPSDSNPHFPATCTEFPRYPHS